MTKFLKLCLFSITFNPNKMEQPLVTVFIITYNSAEFILEGLESVKNQTYKNIELVVSDDCSTDNTVEIVNNWLEKNKNYFQNTVLVTSDKNTGVAPNCNRAVEASSGEWLKILSGDDRLNPDAIESYVKFIQKEPQCEIVFGAFDFFGDSDDLTKTVKQNYEKNLYPLFQQNYKGQMKSFLKRMFVPMPGLFFTKKLWQKIGGYDNKYPMADEYPFTFEVLRNKNKIYFLDKPVYRYNVREDSLCHNPNNITRTRRQGQLHFLDKRWKEMFKLGMWVDMLQQYVDIKIEENNFLPRNKIQKKFYKYLILISPKHLKSAIAWKLKHLSKTHSS